MAPSLEAPEPAEDVIANPIKQKPQLVAPEPEHCPGPESQQAGKADSCAGCPNQAVCASAPKGPDPDIPIISARLENVKHKILVLSGKGGVGKSTFTSLLAHAFATNPDSTVGIMDTDICGPSIPKMMGVEDETVHVSGTGWSPIWVMDNLSVMSIQFLLPNRDDAVIWRGPKKNGLIKQFLKDVEWGDLDFLLVDTPPGTSDEHLSVNSFLKESGIDGAVMITTPQEVSLLDVRKEIDFCRKAGIRVLAEASQEGELLKTLGDFTSKENWDKFFTIKGSGDPFEWYAEWLDLRDPLISELNGTPGVAEAPAPDVPTPKTSAQILVPGCGNSRISENLYDAGFHGITNIDFSKVVISDMLRRNVRSRPDMRWRVMDMTQMQVSS